MEKPTFYPVLDDYEANDWVICPYCSSEKAELHINSYNEKRPFLECPECEVSHWAD